MNVTPEACRSGRAILGWFMRDLAAIAGVALGTVNRQAGVETASHGATAAKLCAAFESHGVELVANDDRTSAVLIYARRKD